MGLLGGLISGVVKTVTAPIAVVKDVIDVAQGEMPTNTAEQLTSAIEDVVEGTEDFFTEGDVI